MSEETTTTTPKIKPLWVIGGGAAVIVLGICAVISLAAVFGLLWFTSETSSNSAQATRNASQRRTQQAVVASPALVTRTAVAIGTLLPTPTPFPVATPIATQSAAASPEQAVRDYYMLVSQERYDESWPLLTDRFKQNFNCCAPNYNYSEYVSWWDSVDHVQFGEVRTVSQIGDRAVVYAELFYVMNTGERSSSDNNPYIHLVYDATMGKWQFDDKRGTP
jgi:hypothetical protein